jgi:acyl carrier protein
MSLITPELNTLFVDAIVQVAGKNVGSVRAEQKISELGLDSVSVMEMVGSLEERLGVTFADDELTKIQTFGDLAGLIVKLKPGKRVA